MKKLCIILVVAAFCCGFIPRHKAPRPTAPKQSVTVLYTDAIKALTIHNDTLKCLRAIKEIFQQDTSYAPAQNLFARVTREPKNAVEFSERAYLSDTTNRFYLEDYGKALVWNQEYDRAIPIFEKIVRRSTELGDYRILAALLNEKGRTSEALTVLDTAKVRFGHSAELSQMRQYYLMRLGRTLEAEAEAKRCVEEAPYIANNHIALAKIYENSRRDSLALVSFQRATTIDPLDIVPWLELCEFYARGNNMGGYLSAMASLFKNETLPRKKKIEMWEELIEDRKSYSTYYSQYDDLIKQLYIHHPESKEVGKHYAIHLVASDRAEDGLRIFKRMLNHKSATAEDFSAVIEIEQYLNRPDSVSHYAALAQKAFPKNVDILMLRSGLASLNNEYEKALGFVEEALKFAKDDSARSQLWGMIGDIEQNRKRTKQSFRAYEKALHLDKDNATVLNNYAYHLSLENRDLERALAMATRANELSANNATFLDTKAWVLYTLGRYAEAKKVMQLALSLNRSKSPEYMLHYGDILHALGEDFMAKNYWRKALELGADKEEIERRFLPEKGTQQKQ